MLVKAAWKLAKNLPRLAVVGAGAGLAWSALAVDHDLSLGPALPGQQSSEPDGSGRRMAMYRDTTGEGTPVLFVHSVNAAASAYEMRPLYTRLQGIRPVWALDLPGYGHSDRGDRAYTPQLMSVAVKQALNAIGRPAHVVALSLGCEFVARTAIEAPDLVESLTLISPTGFGRQSGTRSRVSGVLRFPLWSQAIFDAISSRRSIRFYLGKSFSGPVDELMVTYAHATSHRPGARFAPFTFLGGSLFTPDAPGRLYGSLEVPATVIYDRDPFTSFSRLPEFLAGRPDWSATRIPGTNGLPHWDRPAETVNALTAHWVDVES